MTKLEREEMQRHEAYMSLPVHILFPKPKGFSRTINCKGCGEDFTWTPASGKIRMYCTSECKGTLGSSSRRSP